MAQVSALFIVSNLSKHKINMVRGTDVTISMQQAVSGRLCCNVQRLLVS
jgi:hypothetical protein